MEILKRCAFSYMISAMCGLIVNLLIEVIVCAVTGMSEFNPFSPEYLAMFSSERVAIEVYMLLQGMIGAAFAGMLFIFEFEKIGFVIQYFLYFLLTSIIWVPIVTLIWQLHRYPQALMGVLTGFALTYAIMAVVGYRVTKKEIRQVNLLLEQSR